MEKQEIMSVIAGRKAGTMFSIVVDRPAKLRAAFKAENIRKSPMPFGAESTWDPQA